jgi:hypothetical protein
MLWECNLEIEQKYPVETNGLNNADRKTLDYFNF